MSLIDLIKFKIIFSLEDSNGIIIDISLKRRLDTKSKDYSYKAIEECSGLNRRKILELNQNEVKSKIELNLQCLYL